MSAAVLLAAMLPLLLWPVDEANAQCVGFPVQTNQTCTNSGTLADTSVRGIGNVGLQDLGTLSLTNTTAGVIFASGFSSLGIFANQDLNLTNSGSIAAAGAANSAIGVGRDASVNNSGIIRADDGFSNGIVATRDANVANSGTISANGSQGTGIIAIRNAYVINSGSILTNGPDGFGIFVDQHIATVINSGVISANGSGGIGIVSGETVLATNSGTISANGISGIGIKSFQDASLTNSGIITAGDGGRGVFSLRDATVANTGTIAASTTGVAIHALRNAAVTNSGLIRANDTGGTAIAATLTADVSNSGLVLGNLFAIAATTANVVNSGTISVSAFTGRAIRSLQDANVTNSGVISGTSASTVGISAGRDANVVNSGTISSQGTGTSIGAGRDANVLNSGTILADGTSGAAIIATRDANVTNSGVIAANGPNGVAIIGLQNAYVINSGIVSANGTGGTAILVDQHNATLINSGAISAGSFGIQAFGSSNVTNSGILSGGLAALQLVGLPDTLTVQRGSRIIGAINLGGGGDTVNMRAVNQNLTFDTLTGATVGGTVPYVVSGNRIASVDPTSFATAGSVLSDFSRSVSAIVPAFDGVTASGGGGTSAFAAPDGGMSRIADAFAGIPGLSAYASDEIAYKSPTAVHADGTTVWGRGFGGRHIQSADGLLMRNVTTWFGGAIGVEKSVRPDLRLGVFVGAGSTHNSIDPNNDATDSNLGFGGAYARYTTGASFLQAGAQGGALHSATSRLVNNNLVPNGLETATASYNGWYVSPELTLGHRFELGTLLDSHYALTPGVQLRYLYAGFDGYTETGTTAPLTAGGRNTQNVEERAELKLTRSTQISPASRLLINLSGGALGVQRVGGDTINATLLAQPLAIAAPGAGNVWGGFGGLAMEWQSRNVSLFAAAEYLGWNSSGSIVSGRGGLRVGF
ncbi:autotransporter outer membrane beta-barrel domain-containing protein [Bradyrhizobium sp. AZCC 1610]|uniref:autotransporter outer membrane beta-barrel domain-containing protein n=1 Tax=Bradyrhizobium sp. AZCC 1610 TaxID=3117020 RepID=UPI002FEEEE3D